MCHHLFALLRATLLFTALVNSLQTCSPSSFIHPILAGAEILRVDANEVRNFTTFSISPGTSSSFTGTSNTNSLFTINFCNVTVTYTHPGWNDTINVHVWLPLNEWNGKLQALGGGGYNVGFGPLYLTQAVAHGYVAIESDGGHATDLAEALSPRGWALSSPGNVNLYLLEDYASRALLDLPVVGKAILEQYFGRPPSFSYFRGCSGGGRQAHLLAQMSPESFDGFLAAAPALNIHKFIPAAYWGHQVMNNLGVYPDACEIDAFTRAAIAACDGYDGVKDGIISDHSRCNFSAYEAVGDYVDCNGTTIRLSEQAAEIVQAIWDGPSNTERTIGWFGLSKDTVLSTNYAATSCTGAGTCSTSTSDDLYSSWLRYFLFKDPDFNMSNMTTDDFLAALQLSSRLYDSPLSTTFPDLSALRNSTSKMITFHGLADEAIPPTGTTAYYQQVLRLDPQAADYFRYFEAPGIAHCIGGPGPWPNTAFEQLVDWVEDGIIPETLIAEFEDGTTRPLCPYPAKQTCVVASECSGAQGRFECVNDGMVEEGHLLSDVFPFYRPS